MWAYTRSGEHTMNRQSILHLCEFTGSLRTGCAIATPNMSMAEEGQRLDYWVCKEPCKIIIRVFRWEVFREWIMCICAPQAFLLPPNGLTTLRRCRIVCDRGWSHSSSNLVFHVRCITDGRVIKAAVNVQPFPLLLSCRPTGHNCTLM